MKHVIDRLYIPKKDGTVKRIDVLEYIQKGKKRIRINRLFINYYNENDAITEDYKAGTFFKDKQEAIKASLKMTKDFLTEDIKNTIERIEYFKKDMSISLKQLEKLEDIGTTGIEVTNV